MRSPLGWSGLGRRARDLCCKMAAHLGPLHTRARSSDHEIVRAQMKVSKGRPNTPPELCGVVTGPQV